MENVELHQIAVIGGGIMGRSIATKVSQAGLSVLVKEITPERAEQVKQRLDEALQHQVERWTLTGAEKRAILSRITFTASYDGITQCQLVIETIQENFDDKKRLLSELDQLLSPQVPIVVNTSTLSITELASGLHWPERVLGMHFLYPVPTTRVVEVVRGQVTSNEAFEIARYFARVLGKVPIEVFESPGFVTTRIVLALVNEAMYVAMEGVASPAEVDLAIKLGYDFRMGPLEWADRVGLHKILNWLQHLFDETGDPKFRPCPLLRKLVRAGHTGARAGKGFFTYDAARNRIDRLPDDTPQLS
ncbi:MAG: 3-hydroxyacyl-CoA dehydrogenase NAD-binding domain-containing protein [Thermoanaerobaculum sp.]|nr:3-hydroxyacyl-CoA dehydrogenase NAD-binding domain-containing protein [Thermoanaerobaculum sp.]